MFPPATLEQKRAFLVVPAVPGRQAKRNAQVTPYAQIIRRSGCWRRRGREPGSALFLCREDMIATWHGVISQVGKAQAAFTVLGPHARKSPQRRVDISWRQRLLNMPPIQKELALFLRIWLAQQNHDHSLDAMAPAQGMVLEIAFQAKT